MSESVNGFQSGDSIFVANGAAAKTMRHIYE
jgi:hypothetical protein